MPATQPLKIFTNTMKIWNKINMRVAVLNGLPVNIRASINALITIITPSVPTLRVSANVLTLLSITLVVLYGFFSPVITSLGVITG